MVIEAISCEKLLEIHLLICFFVKKLCINTIQRLYLIIQPSKLAFESKILVGKMRQVDKKFERFNE
jgi:hypothetical protein